MYRPVNQVIAIVPKLGTGEIPATPSSSPIIAASDEATGSFSVVLEKAILSPSGDGTLGGTSVGNSQATFQGNCFGVTGPAKREARPSDFKPSESKSSGSKPSGSKPSGSKTSDSQRRGNALSQALTSSGDALDKTVPVQPTHVRALAGSAIFKISTPDIFPTREALGGKKISASALEMDSTSNKRAAQFLENKFSDSKLVGAKPVEVMPEEAKLADLATSEAQGRGNGSSQTLVSASESQSIVVPPVLVPPAPAPALDWKIATNDLTPDILVTGADLNHASRNNDGKFSSASASGLDLPVEPNAIGGAALPHAPLNEVIPTEHPGGPNLQKSAVVATPDTRQKEAVARLISSLSGAPASDPKTQPGNEPIPLRDVSRDGGTADNNRTPALVKPEGDQFAVLPSVVPPAIVFPMPTPGNVDSGNSSSQGPAAKPALDQSKTSATQVSVTPDVAGTIRKSVEATGGAKAQPRKDDSPASANSQAADQSKGSVPAKAIEASPSSSAAVSQPLSTGMTGEGKNANASLPPNASGQQTSQFDPESTGVAHGQTQPESQAAYPLSLINSAKLVERIGEAELRLGIRAGEFGSVDIRTSMVRNQFTAEISVERGELGRVMAAELPSLQDRLMEQRVPVANITVQNHTGSHSAGSEQQKPRDGQQVYTTNSLSRLDEGPMPALVALEGTAPASRLDIHM